MGWSTESVQKNASGGDGTKDTRRQLGEYIPWRIVAETLPGDTNIYSCRCRWGEEEVKQEIRFLDVPQEHFEISYYCPGCDDLICTISQLVADGGRIN